MSDRVRMLNRDMSMSQYQEVDGGMIVKDVPLLTVGEWTDWVPVSLDLGLCDGVTTNPSLVAKTGRKFDDVESELSRDWGRARGSSNLTWENAKHATRDSWQRVSDAVERAVPGDSDRDGK